jgi:GMP synthase (glutamine-hydrolysing)
MKKLYIIKVGATFPATAKRFGDFDVWTVNALGKPSIETHILDVERGAALPSAVECAGVVITGSHSMVTDNLLWSIRMEKWIPSLLTSRIPLFGICYGHQLLARAAGGRVGFHPSGIEIGTIGVRLLPQYSYDALFQGLPLSFSAHTAHSQTVLSLPPNAVGLAFSDHDPNQAFRLGDCAWGVQFHPEYTSGIMRSYIEEQAEELSLSGRNVAELLCGIAETPFAAKTLRNFARIVEGSLSENENIAAKARQGSKS